MEKNDDLTVKLTELLPDRCNFRDRAFEDYVTCFMRDFMPGFPLGLLDTESEASWERWRVEPADRFVVDRLEITVWTCSECGDEYFEKDIVLMQGGCCLLEQLAAQIDADEDEELAPFDIEDREWAVLRDTDYALLTYVQDAGDHLIEVPGEGAVWGWMWDWSNDAETKAASLNYEAMHEDQSGWPWADNWCYRPDDRISDEDLKKAGFTVATYCGEAGDVRSDEGYRLAGVDGGGFSFKGAIFAPLVAIVSQRLNWTVPTDNGDAYITTEE